MPGVGRGTDILMDDVKPFAFGRADAQPPVMLSGLDRLGDKLARRLRAILEPLAGTRPDISARPVELIEYAAWAPQVPPLASIGVYRLLPLKGNVLLRMDSGMISFLVDRFYGGAGKRPGPYRTEFTPTEDRLILRLSEAFMAALVICWADLIAVEPIPVMREAGIGFPTGIQPKDQVALQRFQIDIGGEEEWPIDLLLPIAALRAIEPLMGAGVDDHDGDPDPAWQARIARQMGNIRLPARTVLARPELSLAQLMELQPGDVIPVHINRSLPLIVGDRVIAQGSIGERDGQAAFMIETMSQDRN